MFSRNYACVAFTGTWCFCAFKMAAVSWKFPYGVCFAVRLSTCKSCRFYFTTFTKYVCIVYYHNVRSILWGYWRLSSTFHHDKRIFHWHWFCWWACPRVLVTSFSFSFHFPILRYIYQCARRIIALIVFSSIFST